MFTMSALNSSNTPSKMASTPAEENVTSEGEQYINLQELISASVKEQMSGFLEELKKETVALRQGSKRSRAPSPMLESDDEPPSKKPAVRTHTAALMEETESEAGEHSSSSDGEKEDEEWLQRLASCGKSEEKGPPLCEKIANAMNEVLEGKMEDQQIKSLEEEYACPANTPLLTAQRVNECIWMNLKFAVRRKDIKHGHIQEKIAVIDGHL